MAFARNQNTQSNDLIILTVTGWKNSTASPDSLVPWLERKASHKITDVQFQGDALLIAIKPNELRSFIRMNNFTWAGVQISITEDQQPANGPRNNGRISSGPKQNDLATRITTPRNDQQRGPRKELFDQSNTTSRSSFGQRKPNDRQNDVNEVEKVIISVLHKRYNAAAKFLDFTNLKEEPEFQAIGLLQQPASKVFQAIFAICEKNIFETPTKRREMVESLSFSDNGLTTVQDIIAASSVFPTIKNLDLSKNQLPDTGALKFWKNRFPNLEHLILADNAVDQSPKTKPMMRQWYKNLKMYNNLPVEATTALGSSLQQSTPPLSASPAPQLPAEPHPEFPAGSTFGVPQPGKSEEQLLKEQMGLQFSFATRLKMQWVEQCLTANNFNYDLAMADLQRAMNEGAVPSEAFLNV